MGYGSTRFVDSARVPLVDDVADRSLDWLGSKVSGNLLDVDQESPEVSTSIRRFRLMHRSQRYSSPNQLADYTGG